MKEPYVDGKQMEKSTPSKPPLDKDDMTSRVIQLSLFPNGLISSTPESAVERQNPTSTDKLKPFNLDTHSLKLSGKSAADSILNVRKCLPYWDESCKELSAALSLPTKIDWQDSVLTCIDGSANKTGANSWFSMKQTLVQSERWLRTSWQSFTVSPPDSTDCENTSLKSKKIRIYPNFELNRVWRRWLAACRYCFNQAINYQRKHGRIGKRKLRNIIMQSDLPQWVKDSPCHIRQNAIFDAHQAFSASRDAKFRSCRDRQQTIKFNACNFSQGMWYPKLVKGLGFIASEPIPQNSDYGTQLTFGSCQWFAIFPVEVEITKLELDGAIALDPGVRTFLTGFDGHRFVEFGRGDIGRITRLCQHLDDLISRMSKSPSRQRKRNRQAANRLRLKIRNLIDEAHKQIGHYLTRNYRIIFLPTFETSQMVSRARRKIRSKTVRAMLGWAHYRFELFLDHQAKLTGSTVVKGSEAYSSKTCTKCGHIHQSLGGSKVFKCKSCGNTLPRDFNGALGFMLRALRDSSFTVSNNGVAIAALSGNYPYCVA
jgi:putative transposase